MMNAKHIRPPQRVNAFDGMKMDAAVWNQAHHFHLHMQRLHNHVFHGTGIVFGLDVSAIGPRSRSLLINPGVAADRDGSLIIVPEAQEYALTSKRKGTLYLILQFREVPAQDSSEKRSKADRQSRLQQAFRIQESETPGGDLDIELARVEMTDETSPLTDAEDFLNPQANQIDLRFRQYAGTHVRGEICIGQLVQKDQKQAIHTDGLFNLIEHMNNDSPYRAHFSGHVTFGDEFRHCNVLYFAGDKGFELTQEEKQTLGTFIDKGGFLWGDGCRRSSKDHFGLAFDQLAKELKRKPVQVTRGHPVFGSHYVFSESPRGAHEGGAVLSGDGLAYCGIDYGCAWKGGSDKENLSREMIRAALEFGTNIAVFGFRRGMRHRQAKD